MIDRSGAVRTNGYRGEVQSIQTGYEPAPKESLMRALIDNHGGGLTKVVFNPAEG